MGTFVYSGSADHTVRKIDPDGDQVWSFTGHNDRVWVVAVDADGNVYSGSWDDTVRKIDPDGNEVWSFTGH
ncbi:MAG: PQQ-binding-like beta-propeller repeat protein, partial [Nitriliruptoraceae bacterium]